MDDDKRPDLYGIIFDSPTEFTEIKSIMCAAREVTPGAFARHADDLAKLAANMIILMVRQDETIMFMTPPAHLSAVRKVIKDYQLHAKVKLVMAY